MPSKSEVSVSPSLVEVLQSSHPGLQSQVLWAFLVSFPFPQAGKPDVGLRNTTVFSSPQWESFFGTTVLQCVGQPAAGVGFDYIMTARPTPNHLVAASPVFGCGVSFFFFFDGFQRPPVSGCSTASCDFGAFAGDELTSSFCTILNLSQK